MTTKTAQRGSGRRTKSVDKSLNTRQKQLGLGNADQCLPTLNRNTGIEPEDRLPNLKAAVLMRIQAIHAQSYISEEMAAEAKNTAEIIEKYGVAMLYGKYFIQTAWAIAILSFQKEGFTAFGFSFKSELKGDNAA